MTDPRFANVPLLLEPRAWSRLGTATAALAGPTPDRIGAYELVAEIAVITVSGVLVQRLGTAFSWGFVTGYDGLRSNLLAALADPAARAIVFLIDSPGGEVAGLFDLADLVYAARGSKPIWAICDDGAYSAAYALACACDVVTVPRTGGCGSVGVITALLDVSAALKQAGIEPHFITYGKRKAAETRAQYTGVTADVLAGVQAEVDAIGELFVATVARNRGLAEDAVREQEAACFQGPRAVAAGLADVVCSADAAFLALMESLGN